MCGTTPGAARPRLAYVAQNKPLHPQLTALAALACWACFALLRRRTADVGAVG